VCVCVCVCVVWGKQEPEDGVLTPETCRSIFNINLHYLFVHMLVYNKQFITI